MNGQAATERITLKHRVADGDATTAVELLATLSGLSRGRIKDAMNKGAVWLSGRRGGRHRLRRASSELHSGDVIELFYDGALLALTPPQARCLHDTRKYSIWFKPPGLLAQGTDYGDHCSLLRQVEQQLKRPVFLVHRLDREACGLMLVAHVPQAASQLSRLFQQGDVDKRYRVVVRGDVTALLGEQGRIEAPLDGKRAVTEFRVLSVDRVRGVSTVEVRLLTGRLHQIRRHFDLSGCPLLGDPRYGKGNKDSDGLHLAAVSLSFAEPSGGRRVAFELPAELLPF